MDRRSFLTAMAGVAGAVAVAGYATQAQAASIAPAFDGNADDFFKKLGELDEPKAEEAQYYYYRRRPRYYYRRRRYRCYLRRSYYGWRRVCRWW